MNKYIFREYEPTYLKLFTDEEVRLRTFFDSKILIEHFGSTAVPSLGGKGIIDIYVVVLRDKIEEAKQKLVKAGYEFRPKAGTNQRFFFRRITNETNRGEQRYHVHLTFMENEEFVRDIAFRDHLRLNPDDRNKYAEIKKKAAAMANNNKEVYMEIKQPVIQEIITKIST
jgi:GrpB-like predicted nucleotidyltransferase (UPF0157 family)